MLRLALGCSLTASSPLARAQYPSSFQIFKDGTAVALQDYASLPLSSRTSGTYPPPINYYDQLGRVNFLRSEPANAPLSPPAIQSVTLTNGVTTLTWTSISNHLRSLVDLWGVLPARNMALLWSLNVGSANPFVLRL